MISINLHTLINGEHSIESKKWNSLEDQFRKYIFPVNKFFYVWYFQLSNKNNLI
jgi:uncharacterized membrane protein (DUF485 family)